MDTFGFTQNLYHFFDWYGRQFQQSLPGIKRFTGIAISQIGKQLFDIYVLHFNISYEKSPTPAISRRAFNLITAKSRA